MLRAWEVGLLRAEGKTLSLVLNIHRHSCMHIKSGLLFLFLPQWLLVYYQIEGHRRQRAICSFVFFMIESIHISSVFEGLYRLFKNYFRSQYAKLQLIEIAPMWCEINGHYHSVCACPLCYWWSHARMWSAFINPSLLVNTSQVERTHTISKLIRLLISTPLILRQTVYTISDILSESATN